MHKLKVVTKAEVTIYDAIPDGARLVDALRHAQVGPPLLAWRCGQGTCGACVVRVQFPNGIEPPPLTRMERNVLARHGLGETEESDGVADPDRLRLACHVRVSCDLVVYIKND